VRRLGQDQNAEHQRHRRDKVGHDACALHACVGPVWAPMGLNPQPAD
jgi:hypothetical protein